MGVQVFWQCDVCDTLTKTKNFIPPKNWDTADVTRRHWEFVECYCPECKNQKEKSK